MSKVLVLGASGNPQRYANIAMHRLVRNEYEVVAVGRKEATVAGILIQTGKPDIEDIDTITLYLNPTIQEQFKEYIEELAPRRIIFNPGTENPDWYPVLKSKGIETEEACTLVLLSTRSF